MKNVSPLSKLAVTVVFIVTTVSFSKYDITGLIPLFLYPAVMFMWCGISVKDCIKSTAFVLPLILMAGILNPFFDKTPFSLGGLLVVRGGIISFITLFLKGILCLSASYIFARTTQIDEMCANLRRVHVPKIIVTVFLLTWRYIFVMKEEVSIMLEAYHLRSPNQKGIHYSAWGSFLGQLFLRSFDRADELYQAMILRGYNGNFFYACCKEKHSFTKSLIFFLILSFLILISRFFNITEFFGRLITI